MNNNKIVAALLVFALALAVSPTASATAVPNSATIVEAGDVDAAYVIAAMPAAQGAFAAVCYVDVNGDGTQQNDEPVYLVHAGACGKVVTGDVRLTNFATFPGGKSVLGSDDDFDRALTAPTTANIVFFDADGNGAYNKGDTIVLHFANCVAAPGACGNVAINDVVLSGSEAFKRVTQASASFNLPLIGTAGPLVGSAAANAGVLPATTSAEIGFANLDGEAGYTAKDTVYFNALGVLIAAPPAAADVGDLRLTALGTTFAAGTIVDGDDVDTTPAVAGAGYIAWAAGPLVEGLCYVDINGDAALSQGEPVYLQKARCGADSVAAGDLRVVSNNGFAAGSLVKGSDDDFARDTVFVRGAAAAAAAAAGAIGDYCFFDSDGSGAVTAGDQIWMNLAESGACVLNVNDVLLNGGSGFVQVTGTTPGLNNAGASLPAGGIVTGSEVFFDADGIGGAAAGATTAGDYVYLDTDGSGTLTINDVRLTAAGLKMASTMVAPGDVDLVYTAAASGHTADTYVDSNGNGVVDANEPIYLTVAGAAGQIAAGDVRIGAFSPYVGGSIVNGGDDDFSRVLAAPAAATWASFDSNGNGIYNAGETVYFDTDGSGTITIGDYEVTTTKYDRVAAGHAFMNNALTAVAAAPGAAEIFFNADGVGAGFTTKDTLYLDMDASGTITIGDVRLTALGDSNGKIGGDVGGDVGGSNSSSSASSSASSTASSSASSTASSSASSTASSTASSSGSSSAASSESTKTPGFELVALVAALGAALVLVRRRL